MHACMSVFLGWVFACLYGCTRIKIAGSCFLSSNFERRRFGRSVFVSLVVTLASKLRISARPLNKNHCRSKLVALWICPDGHMT